MARRKRTSQMLEKAARRAPGINSIDPNLDVGNGLSLPAFSILIETMQTRENITLQSLLFYKNDVSKITNC